MELIAQPKPISRSTESLLFGLLFIGVGIGLYGLWEDRFLPRTLGFVLLGIAVTAMWPELTLLAIFGGTNERSYFLLGMLNLPSSGPLFSGLAMALLLGAAAILM